MTDPSPPPFFSQGHPNIVKIESAYEDANDLHIVMELCRGGELFDEIVRRARSSKKAGTAAPACFDEATAVSIIRSLLEAVAYLHERDIVHRDIKVRS